MRIFERWVGLEQFLVVTDVVPDLKQPRQCLRHIRPVVGAVPSHLDNSQRVSTGDRERKENTGGTASGGCRHADSCYGLSGSWEIEDRAEDTLIPRLLVALYVSSSISSVSYMALLMELVLSIDVIESHFESTVNGIRNIEDQKT